MTKMALTGLYYPPESFKTRLCLRGRDLLYERCKKYNIPHHRLGKLVVALPHQRGYIEHLHAKSLQLKWPAHSNRSDGLALPTEVISGEQAREYEPNLSPDIACALWCPMTGIVDSHGLMTSFEKDIKDSAGGHIVYSTRVVRVDAYDATKARDSEAGWVVQVATGKDETVDALLARNVINAAGLSSTLILNSILPREARIPMYHARGSYASYRGPGVARVSHLIYPCPEAHGTAHGFHSLGTHLTLDLQGNVRFGPDLEWISPPPEVEFSDEYELSDFWAKYLVPDGSRINDMHDAVKTYLPSVTLEGFQPDYVGVRPKIVGPQHGFQDFVFRQDYSSQDNRNPMISLLNIESPGLTSCMAIAEYIVEDLLAKD